MHFEEENKINEEIKHELNSPWKIAPKDSVNIHIKMHINIQSRKNSTLQKISK